MKMYEETHSFIATMNPTLPGFLAAYQMEDEDKFPVFVFNQEVKNVLQPVAAKQCAEKQGAQTFFNVPFKQCGLGACVFQVRLCTH